MVLLVTSTAGAQDEPTHRWSHGATLAASLGVGGGSADPRVLAGGAIGWEIRPRLAVTGGACWFDRPEGASAFSASLNLHAVLTKSHPAAPFVEGGFGLHLASFDPKRATDVPDFYAQRMSGNATNTFTDPAFFIGSGINVMKTAHFAVRPTVGGVFPFHGSDGYGLWTTLVTLEYHFEDHPLRPFR
jgi:hypothetical protein